MRAASPEFLFFLGAVLIFIGIFVILLGLLPMNRAEGVGVVIIGPFPIIFQGEMSPTIFLVIMLILALTIIVIFGTMRKFVHLNEK